MQALTLAGGNPILTTHPTKAMCGPANLSIVCPATAMPRGGTIHAPGSERGWAPAVASWLQSRRPQEAAALKPCFDKYVEHMLHYTR